MPMYPTYLSLGCQYAAAVDVYFFRILTTMVESEVSGPEAMGVP